MSLERSLVRNIGAALVCAMVPVIALVFVPLLGSPFEAPKRAVFVVMVGAVAAFACLYASRRMLEVEGGARAGIRSLAISLLGLGVVEIMSAVNSPLGYFARPALVHLGAFVGFVWGCAALIGRRERAVLWSIAGAGVAEAIVALVQASGVDLLGMLGFSTLRAGRMSVYGTLGNPNFVATFCAATVPALFALRRMVPTKVLGATLWVLIAIVGTGVLCTGSRGGILATAVAVVGSVLMLAQSKARVRIAIAMLVVVVAGTLVPMALQNPRTVKDALAGRVFIWRATLAEGRGSLLGSGPNTFAYRYPVLTGKMFNQVAANERPFAGIEHHAQNDFVEVWSELGLLGLLALGGVGVTWLRVAKPPALIEEGESTAGSRAAVAGIAALMAAALFDFPLHRPEGLTLLAVWMAIPMAASVSAVSRREHVTYAGVVAGVVIGAIAIWFGGQPLAGEWQVLRGDEYGLHARYEEQTESYRKAVALDGLNGDARFKLTQSLAMRGTYPEALAASQELMRCVNEPVCWQLRARIYRRMGSYDAALRELHAAATVFPQSQELRDEIEFVEQDLSRR